MTFRNRVTMLLTDAQLDSLTGGAQRCGIPTASFARRELGRVMGWSDFRDASEKPAFASFVAVVPESRVERDDDIGLGDVEPSQMASNHVPRADPARLARARAVLGRGDRGGLSVSADLAPKPARQAITQPESRVERDHEAMAASKRSGNDSGRGL